MEDWIKEYLSTKDEEHGFYLSEAYKEAKKSPDPCTKLGVLLVNENGEIVIKDHNKPTRGVSIVDAVRERKKYFEHAERNAIFQAASRGITTKGLVLYCPWHPCRDCARAIVSSKITKVISHRHMFLLTPLRCIEKFVESYWILKKGGVDYFLYSEEIKDISIRFKESNILLGYNP